jgi:hypothetical protein
MIAPLGWEFRPAACRTNVRTASWIVCQVPSRRHDQKQ